MASNDNPFATDDSDAAAAPQQQQAPAPAAPDQPSPILQYFKTLLYNSVFDPVAAMKMQPPPVSLPTYPPLTPEQQAIPYRAVPRSYEDAGRAWQNLNTIASGQPISDDDLVTSFMGANMLMQPLRGIGDIVNYFRGTNYPHEPTPTPPASFTPASPAAWPLPPNAT